VRILFSVRKPSNIRHYDSVLRALAARGHEIELVREPLGDFDWPHFVLDLAKAFPGIRLETGPLTAKTRWWELATRYRRALFYLRFFDPAYEHAPALRARARKRAPRPAVWIAEVLGAPGRCLLRHILKMLDQSTQAAAVFHQYLRERRPDVVVLTPLVVLKTSQLDLARAAIEMGIRNVFAVASWDHLSSKGALSISPQQVIVWNEVQRREAVELHHLEVDTVVVTGSQVFDDWFDREPSTSREAFCARVGLRPDRPFILYVCSSLLEGSSPEPPFVVQWARHLRGSGHPILRDCGILVRPHHEHGEAWRRVNFAGFDNIVCWPRMGETPVDVSSKNDYYDSMYHAAVTVGLNTSAMIEAAILGRPVHTVLLPEFHDSQEGTVHFQYLLDGPGALLHASRSLDDHARNLAAALDGRDPDPDRSARFVQAFVRPRGIDTPATTQFVEALEQLAACPAPVPAPVPVWTHVIRPFLQPFAYLAAERVRRMEEESRRRSERRLLEHRQAKEPLLEEYRRRKREDARAARVAEAAQVTRGTQDAP